MHCGFQRGSSHGRHLAAIFDHRQCVWGTWRRVSLTGVVGFGSSLKKELQGQCSTPFSLWLYFCPSPWLPWTAAMVLLELRTAPGPDIYFSLLPSSVALERPLLAYPRALLSLVFSVRVQSQRVLHNLAILDLGGLVSLLGSHCLPSCLFSCPPQPPCQMSDEKKSRGWWCLGSHNGSWPEQAKFNNLDETGHFLKQ